MLTIKYKKFDNKHKIIYHTLEPIKIQQMEKVRITIEVDPKLKEAFLQKAKKDGRTMKWLIKEYIKKYID